MSDHEPNRHETWRVLYTGRVQGVGFRVSAHEIARGFQVAGIVRNLPDGRVEIIAQGPAEDVQRFLAAVAQRFQHHVRGTTQERLTASKTYDRFDVAH